MFCDINNTSFVVDFEEKHRLTMLGGRILIIERDLNTMPKCGSMILNAQQEKKIM